MKPKSYCLIVNTTSNSGRALKVIYKHIKEIQSLLIDVEIYEVQENESISDITRTKSLLFDVIVACGGDGTVQKVAIGLIGSNALFGVLPLGTGNDFAKMLGLKTNFLENLRILKKSTIREIDIISFNKTYFVNTLGIGFDGHTNYIASKSKLKGKIKYIVSGMEALFYSQKFTILIDENDNSRRFITRLVIIANGKWEGGKYLVSPTSENNDGMVEVIILNDITRFRLATEFIKLSLGKMLSVDLFTLIRTNQLDIRLDKSVYIHSDGEIQTPNQHIGVKVMDKKLKTIISTF